MSRWWIAAVVLVVAVALFLSRPSTAQPPAPNPPGRYQLQKSGSAPNSTAFVIDTQTGQVWYKQTAGDTKVWTDMGSPEKK